MTRVITAGELSKKALSDNSSYDPLDIAHGVVEDLQSQLQECIQNYYDKIEQDEFCVVMVIAKDPLLVNLTRRKFYCWPYLPSPRPNQSVFLYNKRFDRITKRLWVLPYADAMAVLATPGYVVAKEYETMQAWSRAFFSGTFWDFIRKEHGIKMLSQEEFDALNAGEIAKSGVDKIDPHSSESFDFTKIQINDVEHACQPILSED